jgi:membrane fusion protein, copper/silver efflux system
MEAGTGENQDTQKAPKPRRAAHAGGRVVAALLVGALAGGGVVWMAMRGHGHDESTVKKGPLYQCPMHPAITSDHPGECPICGMKLVLIAQHAEDSQAKATAHVEGMATVTIDPGRQQLIGLRTAKVGKGSVGGIWHTVARIEVAPTRVRKTNVKVEGFVERVFVDFVGQSVRKGQPLFSIYSPALLAAQNEYLLALQTKESLAKGGAAPENGDSLVTAARRRLELWDVPASEIARLTSTREPSKTLTLVSPIAGVVTAKNVVQGARLSPGEAPYEITDLGEVWAMADAYESDLTRVQPGMKASLTLAAYPDRVFTGSVAFIDPVFDAKTRTVKVHLHFMNPKRELKPEMFGEVTLQGVARDGLRIPADAVIRAGMQDVVFLSTGAGKFEPRVVRIGTKNGDEVEVTGGLELGQEVVTRANFLVDSESQLRASLAAIGGK